MLTFFSVTHLPLSLTPSLFLSHSLRNTHILISTNTTLEKDPFMHKLSSKKITHTHMLQGILKHLYSHTRIFDNTHTHTPLDEQSNFPRATGKISFFQRKKRFGANFCNRAISPEKDDPPPPPPSLC